MSLRAILAATILAVAASSPALAEGRQDFRLSNKTGYSIHEVYVSPSSTSDWQDDVLGRDTLEDGEYADITFSRKARPCDWDLKVVWDDGTSSAWDHFDLCTTSRITIHYDRKKDRTWAEYE